MTRSKYLHRHHKKIHHQQRIRDEQQINSNSGESNALGSFAPSTGPHVEADATWIMPAGNWAQFNHLTTSGTRRKLVQLPTAKQQIIMCKTQHGADGFELLPEVLWDEHHTAAARNYISAHPIGRWNLDPSITVDQAQKYVNLVCVMLNKVCEGWRTKDGRNWLEGKQGMFDPLNNVIKDHKLPPVLLLLCGSLREKNVAPTPYKKYVRVDAKLIVNVVLDTHHNRLPKVLHSLSADSRFDEGIGECARNGQSEAVLYVASYFMARMAEAEKEKETARLNSARAISDRLAGDEDSDVEMTDWTSGNNGHQSTQTPPSTVVPPIQSSPSKRRGSYDDSPRKRARPSHEGWGEGG